MADVVQDIETIPLVLTRDVCQDSITGADASSEFDKWAYLCKA